MLLAALLLPVAILLVVPLVQRFGLPAYLALMAVVLAYGVAADMTVQSIGRAFGLGFVASLEQVGLPVVAGGLVGRLIARPALPLPALLGAGVLGGLGGSPVGALALLQSAAEGARRPAIMLALVLLIVPALVVPSPLAVAAASVLHADFATLLRIAIPVAFVAALAGWQYVRRILPADPPAKGMALGWVAVLVPLLLLIVQAVAQIPSEPLGKGGARELYTGISHPLMLLAIAVGLAFLLSGRWREAPLGDTSWAPLLLLVGAAGGFARVLDETGMAELLAEKMLHPSLGLLAPFLAAATVKTMQGNSLSAVLTAAGMVEPMLPALGLDSGPGRALAAAAVGAGSIAICHVNDPLFWIAAAMARLAPGPALFVLSLGSGLVALASLLLLMTVRLALA